MLDGERLEFCAPAGPIPGFVAAVARRVAESPVHAAAVARSRHRHGVDRLGLQGFIDTRERNGLVQRVNQAHVAEDGAESPRVAPKTVCGRQSAESHPPRHVKLVDVVRTQAAPEMTESVKRLQPSCCGACQARHIERARRCAHQNLKGKRGRRARTQLQHRSQGLKHAHLIGRAGATAHQDQGVNRSARAGQSRVNDRVQAHGPRTWPVAGSRSSWRPW